jgi:hypothetical protein
MCTIKSFEPSLRHDQNLRFSKSLSHLKIYYSRLTPVISHFLIVNTMLKIGQVVMERRCLISDLLAVLIFEHACLALYL